ncbi:MULTISPECIES: DUF2971 domain-containing protein [Rhizobium]|uniref:DUF2971 domain-containing protein n=1 Tax=Rhizobium leguminosarum bv. viciae TaxID=387 RepID=A0A8G2IUU0_RHILV|nr:DUF2971 domain-containing protein [Rhizobium leguminosarum]NKK11262.1 DUF2971 domain-containing protein [Rhizobium leguminosarum bv. viciae]NKK25087.1 DUF2971 domain-containing protein [Rhizobium leguminosarum bv. viciae]TBX85165.1 DUF2971 domain-containing protein [Rhizobium leguminosarum bv. viciae]TBY78139.1 DUF2971 domain-containing protein [Rhizobium leguminosarum bv. viciae]TBZ09928.1 DUF2971 domain-containing protein [Rhizobium leguminosarum bv. viciae]
MIVYKYVSLTALRGIIESHRIGFTRPIDFNDPFDQPRVLRSAYPRGMNTLFDTYVTGEEMARNADTTWGQCAVASFTRTYDNGLMWSHYADSHRGAVIEIDADVAKLTSRGLLIPVQFGSVIYMKRPNRDTYENRKRIAEIGDQRFDIENYELLQRLFLSKPISWAYEEEVRAVADIHGQVWNDRITCDGLWKKIDLTDKTIFGLTLPKRSITRVFAGSRFSEMEWLKEQSKLFGFEIMTAAPAIETYDLSFNLRDDFPD